ncbi:MAG: hypothetical protein LBS55_11155, partial [Prevotellaceae bacterium]|nr:hypothetical protein [Prevotellaceae bacterium]
MRCLELSGRTEEVWDINENDKSTKDHFLLLKGIIEQFVKKEGIAGFEEIDYKLFPKFLKEMESFPHNIKDLITLNWADLHCDDNNDMAREYARNLVKTILESPHLTTAQYVNVLSRYTTMTAYSDAAISLLKKAQKRSDLTRDQRFFVDAKLAYYDALNNGPKYLQKLIKDYPDKRQCVGIAGEQIALRYRSSVNAPQDAKEKALECYTTVMKLCPEMYNEASSLLGYTTTCREGGKPKIVLDYLRRYIDAHPKEPDTLEVLLTLAYIYHDDLEEYETAVQIWDELVEFDVPESLLTDYLKEI